MPQQAKRWRAQWAVNFGKDYYSWRVQVSDYYNNPNLGCRSWGKLSLSRPSESTIYEFLHGIQIPANPSFSSHFQQCSVSVKISLAILV
jgi:hypothetical protein